MSQPCRRWQACPQAPPSHVARFPHLHPVTVQVLYGRGLTQPSEVAAFLDGTQGDSDPFALAGVEAAVERLRRALQAGERIAVYGDFDVDGVSATAVLVLTLRALGGSAQAYIPHRVEEGYGLNVQALDRLAAQGVSLVVTADCGARSIAEVAHARTQGLDIIITDHHSTAPDLPPAVALVDPKQPGDRYPFGELAGVGIAYRLAQALLRTLSTPRDCSPNGRLDEHDLLDLVALGTVADLVPLREENRTLVQQGIEQLNRLERPGIEALCRQAGIRPGRVDATAISYALGPRLNAAGRMDHAGIAYELLTAEFPVEAERLAARLEGLNRERQRLTAELIERARAVAERELEKGPLLFLVDPDYAVGIAGLVAGRLVEEFHRPVVVVERGRTFSRGSARSIVEFDITGALDACADLLVQHGGHAAAAGFTARTEHLEALAERLRALASEQLGLQPPAPVLPVDAEVPLHTLTWDVQRELARLEPFGYANPPPLFLSRGVRVRRQSPVGAERQHLRLVLYDGRITWDGIAFRRGEWADRLPDCVDIVYHLEVNEWRDEPRLQLNIQDLRPSGFDETLSRLWLTEDQPPSEDAPCAC